jgi:hypothetical protein
MTRRLPKGGLEKLAADLEGLTRRSDRALRDSWRSLYGAEPPKKIDLILTHPGRLLSNAGECVRRAEVGNSPRLLMRAAEVEYVTRTG